MSGPLPTPSDVASTGGAFAGFDAADFRAYEAHKQSSMKFTLERRRAKDKLLALARSAEAALGPDLAGLELHASDEMPSVKNGKKVEHQLAFFLRDADGQRALRALLNTTDLHAGAALFDIALEHQHACLWIRLAERGLAVGMDLAARAKVDRDNLTEKTKQSWARGRLAELVAALPEGSRVSAGGVGYASSEVDASAVEALMGVLPQGLRAECVVASSDPVLKGPAAVEHVATLLRAFVPLYRFCAWSRENEHAGVKDTIKKTAEERQKKAIAFQPGDRVTILAGLFAGRAGYVAEIDAKGKAKVMVGPVSLSLEVKDLKSA